MARMTTQQLRLVPIEWRQKYKLQVHQEMEEVVEEWHTVALYIKGKNAIIYDPSFNWIPTSEKIPRVSRAPGRAVLVALLEHQNRTRGLEAMLLRRMPERKLERSCGNNGRHSRRFDHL
jgi:hypothetical protein